MPQKKKLPLISLILKKTFMTGHCFQINKMYYNIRSTQAKAIALSYWIVVIDCLPTVRNSINYFLSLRGWGSTPDVPISCYSVTLCPLHFFYNTEVMHNRSTDHGCNNVYYVTWVPPIVTERFSLSS